MINRSEIPDDLIQGMVDSALEAYHTVFPKPGCDVEITVCRDLEDLADLAEEYVGEREEFREFDGVFPCPKGKGDPFRILVVARDKAVTGAGIFFSEVEKGSRRDETMPMEEREKRGIELAGYCHFAEMVQHEYSHLCSFERLMQETGWDDSGILPSVTAAQWVLESGYCTTDLARQAQNCFGMKCELSGNNWKSVWDGSSRYGKLTEEQDRQGNSYRVWAEFRKYPCIEDSIRDHSLYLLGAKNGSRMRYAGLTKAKDYRSAIRIIKDGGYATDVRYVDKICDIIRRYGLDRYDREKVVPVVEAVRTSAEQGKEAVAENAPVAPDGAQEAAGQKLYVVQAGAFDVKGNARKRLREVRKLGGEFKKAFMVKSGGRYLVQTGEFEDEGNARRMAKKLEGHGIEAVVKVR